MREIGSFIELEFPKGKELYSGNINIARVNTGRAAIWYAFRLTGAKAIWIPYYQCDTVRKFLLNKGVEIKYYHQDKNFMPIDLNAKNDEAVLFVNYFGIMSMERMRSLSSDKSNVIIDNCQAFFCKPIDGVLNVYSARKFVGVADGAYVIGTDSHKYIGNYPQGYSSDTAVFLMKRIEYGCEGKSYEARSLNESRVDTEDVMKMSKLTRTILDGVDYDYIKIKRRENFEFACKLFADINKWDPTEFYDCETIPMVYPLVVEDDNLLQKLNNYRSNLIANSTSNNQLNILRNKVFADCGNAGKTNHGNYTLTAPTGTAKTLATLNFALENAKATNKRRIIFVLPYLSIIEQNAKIYRDICGDDIVLEDDSQTIFTDKTKVFSERWSSPIIVTTSVKFFETLFAREGVNLRKLHNIADSVVIFDESQTIPNNILDASLEVLNVLNNKFNVTTLFSTATPPSFQYRKNAYWKAHEVIQNPQQLFDEYAKIKNLKINWMIDKPISDLELFDLVKNKSSYLVIFNLKKHANDFYNMLKNEIGTDGLFYISTNLCSAHRTKVLQKIKQRLDKNLPTKVISTQCLEAGVDIDFQYVLRAFGPATSIAQAAGRCSRNALFPGELTIFIPSGQRIYPDGNYSNASEQLKTQIRVEGNFDICNLANIDSYYHRLFNTLGMDKDDRKLTSSIAAFSYEDVEKNYKLIPNQGVTIIVPYSGCQSEYDTLKQELVDNNYCITKAMIKKAQFFTVTSYNKKETKTYCTELYINMGDSLVECGWYLLDDSLGYYDENVGLNFSSDNQFIF